MRLITIITCFQYAQTEIKNTQQDLTIQLIEKVAVAARVPPQSNVDLTFTVEHTDVGYMDSSAIHFNKKYNAVEHSNIYIRRFESSGNEDIFLDKTESKIAALDTISLVVGWIYFAAWTLAFYPQIYSNWKRKSVVGLHFDFLALNLIGYSLYAIFNLGLYCIEEVQIEYFARYPGGQIPAKINDILFAVLAATASLMTIIQCFIYERGGQRVSYVVHGVIGVYAVVLLTSLILVACDVIVWLDFLYYCSYIKLTTTMIKYVPQAYMNYNRKSTEGWSIENVFLDFTGGTMSMLQMILDAYNYDDWDSISGDPTKFGLGLFSASFDIFFMIQHYILYRHSNYGKQ